MRARRSPEQRRIVVEQIESWLRDYPGATYTELALGIGIHTEDARKLTTRRVRHLVTDLESETKNRGGYQTIWTNDKILQALREAANGSEMLSGGHYADLVAEGAIQGPTLPRVIQVFGSWANACALAGLSIGHTPRDDYSRSWTEDELVHFMAEFLIASDSASIESYAKWSASDPATKRPSAGTIRNQAGQWNDVKARALRELRRSWA